MKPRFERGFLCAKKSFRFRYIPIDDNVSIWDTCLHTTETDMTQIKYPLGPWKIADRGLWDISIVDESGGVVCHISNKGEWFPQPDGSTKGRSHSNMLDSANLIASAPDLLHALKSMVAATSSEDEEKFHGHNKAYLEIVATPRALAAIAKAEGRS